MARQSKQSVTKIEWMIISALVLVFGTTIAQLVGRTPQYFNAYPLAEDLWLLYTLAALGAVPVLYYAGVQTTVSIKAVMALKDEKPGENAGADEKAAYLKKTKPHMLRMMGALFAGMFLSLAAALGVLAINAYATGAGQEVAGVITSLKEASTSSGSNNTRRYFCRVNVQLSDEAALEIIRRRSFCRRADQGDHLLFTRHNGALGLGFYRLHLPEG